MSKSSEGKAEQGQYQIFVSKDNFKFNAAHFIAYPGFREKLHGHNYRVSVRIEGDLGDDGYVVDFGDIKRAARDLCAGINEKVIIPLHTDCIRITREAGQVELVCEDGSMFSMPEGDCAFLAIRHSSAEELAAFLCAELRDSLTVLSRRRVTRLEVGVAEAPNQEARFAVDL